MRSLPSRARRRAAATAALPASNLVPGGAPAATASASRTRYGQRRRVCLRLSNYHVHVDAAGNSDRVKRKRCLRAVCVRGMEGRRRAVGGVYDGQLATCVHPTAARRSGAHRTPASVLTTREPQWCKPSLQRLRTARVPALRAPPPRAVGGPAGRRRGFGRHALASAQTLRFYIHGHGQRDPQGS